MLSGSESPAKELYKKYLDSGKLTNSAYLCFTRANNLFTNAIVKAARFKGTDMSVFISTRDFNGNLLSMTDEVIEFIKRNINLKYYK